MDQVAGSFKVVVTIFEVTQCLPDLRFT